MSEAEEDQRVVASSDPIEKVFGRSLLVGWFGERLTPKLLDRFARLALGDLDERTARYGGTVFVESEH